MSILLTGPMINAPVESLGRSRVEQFGQMDRMTCVFTGPDNTLYNFPISSPHPEYPLMFVTSANAKTIPGGLSEVTIVFDGKLLTNGASSYVTTGVTEERSVQGSRDFVNYVTTVYSHAQPGLIIIGGNTLYTVSTQSVAVRYIGTECLVRYQAYPRPTALQYSAIGLSRVKWTVLSSTYGALSVVGNPGVLDPSSVINALPTAGVPPLVAKNLGFDVIQRGQWYDCVETYGPTF